MRFTTLAGFLLLMACSKEQEKRTTSPAAHAHHAPHGGALVVLGEEFAHVEVTLDAATGRIDVYVLDGEASEAVRIPQAAIEMKAGAVAVVLAAVADPLTGETPGDTSHFAGVCVELKGADHFDAVLAAVTVKGGEFRKVAFSFPKGNE